MIVHNTAYLWSPDFVFQSYTFIKNNLKSLLRTANPPSFCRTRFLATMPWGLYLYKNVLDLISNLLPVIKLLVMYQNTWIYISYCNCMQYRNVHFLYWIVIIKDGLLFITLVSFLLFHQWPWLHVSYKSIHWCRTGVVSWDDFGSSAGHAIYCLFLYCWYHFK